MEIAYISEEEKNICQFLQKINQGHLLANLTSFTPEQRKEFVEQIEYLNKTYPGGLELYTQRARKLLTDSANDVNPYEGWVPKVPKGMNVSFYKKEEIDELEAIGIQEMKNACFVLLAGGLGERLGYGSIKIGIEFELLTLQTFLGYYISYILAFQTYSAAQKPIPLAIMVSEDTDVLTRKLLSEMKNFGMAEGQITILKQEKVPAMIDNEARIAQRPSSLLIDTKPHGHGDVHTLLYMSGLAKKWNEEGRKWAIFFQDTNPLIFRCYPAVLGVSKKYGFEMNTVAIPRKPGEAIGAICNLLNEKNGVNLTINVEYNQLDPLLKSFGGEPVDKDGYSIYPGNTNGLVFHIPDYAPTLQETQGLIAEFINPKYTDNTKTVFKSPTRLECMMQDYPKLLKSGERIGFTQIDRRFCFSTVKNDLKTASQKYKANLAPESASVCEQDFYWLNKEILKLTGVEFEEEEILATYAGVGIKEDTRIVLHPSFGVTLSEIRSRIQGKNLIHKHSNLVLKNKIVLNNFEFDGSLVADKDLTGVVSNGIRIKNVAIDVEDKAQPDYLKIRGYNVDKQI